MKTPKELKKHGRFFAELCLKPISNVSLIF